MSGTVFNLDFERAKRAPTVDNMPSAPILRGPSVQKHSPLPELTQEQDATLGALWRRFHAEADQLLGFMEHLGIAGENARDMRKRLHLVRGEIISARVRRETAK